MKEVIGKHESDRRPGPRPQWLRCGHREAAGGSCAPSAGPGYVRTTGAAAAPQGSRGVYRYHRRLLPSAPSLLSEEGAGGTLTQLVRDSVG